MSTYVGVPINGGITVKERDRHPIECLPNFRLGLGASSCAGFGFSHFMIRQKTIYKAWIVYSFGQILVCSSLICLISSLVPSSLHRRRKSTGLKYRALSLVSGQCLNSDRLYLFESSSQKCHILLRELLAALLPPVESSETLAEASSRSRSTVDCRRQ